MIRISCDDAVDFGTFGTLDHDGVFIIAVIDRYGILTVDAEGIDQLKQGIKPGNDISGFCIYILLACELLSGEKIDVSGFLSGDASCDLLPAIA